MALFYAGCNGAGKSSLRSVGLDTESAFLVIDPDAIAKGICPTDPRSVDVQAGRQAIEHLGLAIAAGQSFSLETTLSGTSVLKRIRTAKAAGFFVELRYVGLACFDLNIERVAQRVAKGGHAIDAQTIERRYKTSLANLPIALQWVDEASIWDNSYEVPQLHLVVSPSSVTVLQAKQPGWIRDVFDVIKLDRDVIDAAAG